MEMHPVGYLFDEENPTFNPDWSYFPTARPLRFDEPGTYTDRDAPTVNNESYEWPHTLGEIVSAIAAAGLTIEFLHELDHTVYEAFPYYERDGAAGVSPTRSPPSRSSTPSARANPPERCARAIIAPGGGLHESNRYAAHRTYRPECHLPRAGWRLPRMGRAAGRSRGAHRSCRRTRGALLDTAPMYGFGESERRYAAPLARLDRSQFVISTKVGRLLQDDAGG